MAALDIVPLDQAKVWLNIVTGEPVDDDELTRIIGAAVERVERHLGVTLDVATLTESQRLGCKVALADYWIAQRPETGPPPAWIAGQDDSPTGPARIPLRTRLTEILGEPAPDPGTGPSGSFPDAVPLPDPICLPVAGPIYWR